MVKNSRSFDDEGHSIRSKSSGRKGNDEVEDRIMSVDPSNDPIIYLNNAGQAWLDSDVQAVGKEMVNNPPFVHPPAGTSSKIRQSFSELIKAKAEDIAIVPSTAFAITLAAKNIQRLYMSSCSNNNEKKRNKILLLQDQMCSAVYPWQDICDRPLQESVSPLSLEIVPYPKGGTGWTEAILKKISDSADEILASCLPPLHWSDGAVVDLAQIAPICHAHNILLVIDATQAVGIMPVDVQQLKPAMLACSIHKWLRGPSGASLVYIDKRLHDIWLPLDQHGRSRDIKEGSAWESYPNEMSSKGYPEIFVRDSRKFDGGGKPNPIVLPMLQKSIEQVVERVNLDTCQTSLRTILDPLLKWVASNPDKFQLPQSSHVYHLIGIRPTDKWLSVEQMLEIAELLQTDYKIYIAVRCGLFRVSPYMNTTIPEMERFVRIFNEVVTRYWMER